MADAIGIALDQCGCAAEQINRPDLAALGVEIHPIEGEEVVVGLCKRRIAEADIGRLSGKDRKDQFVVDIENIDAPEL